MKGLLVSFSGCPRTPSDFIPDNGLALLAGVLASRGHRPLVLDFNTVETLERMTPPPSRRRLEDIATRLFDRGERRVPDFLRLALLEKSLARHRRRVAGEIGDEIADLAAREGFDFVGLKLWNGDGFTGSLEIAARLKRRFPRLSVFGGGPQVDLYRETIFDATGDFDALVYGDGEAALPGLVECLEGKKSFHEVPNLIFRENGRTVTTRREWTGDLDSLPMALYDPEVYPAMAGHRRLRFMVIDESRGCDYHCHFCPHPRKSGKPRRKSPGRVVDEMAFYQRKFGVSFFRYGGSNTPSRLLEGVARLILERKLSLRYTLMTDLRDEETDFRLLRESGCFALFFGLESTDAKILEEKMNKKASPERMERIVTAARKAGIFTAVSLIVPAPGETPETIEKTVSFLGRVRPDSVLVQFPGLFPGTTWTENPARFGFEIRNPEKYARWLMGYQIRLFFPPRFWQALPYRVDGKGFRRFAGETENFVRRVEKELGILTLVADDAALMAAGAGMTPGEFRDRARRSFFTGDGAFLARAIETINAAGARGLPS